MALRRGMRWKSRWDGTKCVSKLKSIISH